MWQQRVSSLATNLVREMELFLIHLKLAELLVVSGTEKSKLP